MRFLIYEDEAMFQEIIKEQLMKISIRLDIPFDIHVIKEDHELLFLNEEKGINVNIIDIEHKNANLQGIEMAEILRKKYPRCHIIFFTSHIEKTYEVLNTYVEPLAYIYKGDLNFDKILENAITKLINSSIQRKDDIVIECKTSEGEIVFVKAQEIYYITTHESKQKYCKFYLYDTIVFVKGTIKDFVNISSDFAQISKSAIVNKTKIKSIKKGFNPKNKIIITSRPYDEKSTRCILTPKYKNDIL